jgi:Fic family protein
MKKMQQSYVEILNNWQVEPIITSSDLDQKLHNFRILFAYHCNKIENPETSYHNTREIFEHGKLINYTGELRTIFEIQNQKECYEFLQDKIISRDAITPEFILQVHKILMKGCYDQSRYEQGERPGAYKKHDYITGDGVGVPSEDVEDEIAFLCNEIGNYQGEDILTCASYFHLNFESIHPFADGNGRVGRVLMNYFLMIHQYPPTIIFDENKDIYYMALAAFDHTESLEGFRKLIQEQTVKTWTRRLRKKQPINLDLK